MFQMEPIRDSDKHSISLCKVEETPLDHFKILGLTLPTYRRHNQVFSQTARSKRVVVARDKVLQLLGRDMKFSLRRASIYELTDLSVLSRLLNSTVNSKMQIKVDNKFVRDFKALASAACPSIGSQSSDRQKQSCSISEASQMPNDQFVANCLHKVSLMLESSEFASKVVRQSSKYPYQAQISDCKQEIADPTNPDSDPLDNLAKCALIQICFERGYEYHDIARRLCSKPNSFSMELSNYAIQRFMLKCSELEFIKAIKRSCEIR